MMLKAIILALAVLPVAGEDKPVTPEKTAQLNAIAAAVHRHAKTPDEAAFVLAWGDAETHYSLRIAEGRCLIWECDRGKARGPWQVHRNAAMSAEQWDKMHGVEHIDEQARVAAARARWALRQCKVDRIRGAFRVLGGVGCTRPIKGEGERVKAFEAMRRRL